MELEQDWFRVWEDRPGIWVIEEPLHSEGVKCCLIIGTDRAALIDTGMGVGDLKSLVRRRTDLPIIVLQSHAHNDHIGSAWQFDDVRIHPVEADALAAGCSAARLTDWFAPNELSGPLPSGFDPKGFSIPGRPANGLLNDGDCIELGGTTLQVMHLPGHSAGGLAFLDRAHRTLYSTDIVYLRQLYLLNPDSSVPDYVQSLTRLAAIVPDLDRLYPSHGPSPISPAVIPQMLAGMQAVQAGRQPDRVEMDSSMEGGREDLKTRSSLAFHDFGDFEILIGSDAIR